MTDQPTPKKRKPITKAAADKAVAAVRNRQITNDQRPYTLESSNLEADLARQRDDALSELAAIDAAILDIKTRQNRDKTAIDNRAEAEIAGRQQRAADLQKIVDIATRGLDLPAPAAIADHSEGNDQ